MGKIINILGPHGVGKTTIQKLLSKYDFCRVYYGFIVPTNNFNLKDRNQYIEYEKKYVEMINEQNLDIKKTNKMGFIIRSVEETIFYLKISQFNYNDSEIYEAINNAVYSDYLIYLTANKKTLCNRIINDKNRDMVETDYWYKNMFIKYDQYFKNLPNVKIICTDDKNIKQVVDEILEIVKD